MLTVRQLHSAQPWGWGMGAEAAQIHVSSFHVGVEETSVRRTHRYFCMCGAHTGWRQRTVVSMRGEGFLSTPSSPVSALLCETVGLSPPWACCLSWELLTLGCFSHEVPHCWTQFNVALRFLRALSLHLEKLTFFQDGEHCTKAP